MLEKIPKSLLLKENMKKRNCIIFETAITYEYFIFQTNIEIFVGNGNEDFHGGYNSERPGARQVDFLGRKIQEGAEKLNVSISINVCMVVEIPT